MTLETFFDRECLKKYPCKIMIYFYKIDIPDNLIKKNKKDYLYSGNLSYVKLQKYLVFL